MIEGKGDAPDFTEECGWPAQSTSSATCTPGSGAQRPDRPRRALQGPGAHGRSDAGRRHRRGLPAQDGPRRHRAVAADRGARRRPQRAGLASRFPTSGSPRSARSIPTASPGLAGIDPYRGMQGLRDLEHAVNELGFVGAHLYPHWFGLAPDHAKYYPYYAKCCELDIPIMMQVGHNLVYSRERAPAERRPADLPRPGRDRLSRSCKLHRHPHRRSLDRRDDLDVLEARERLHRPATPTRRSTGRQRSCTTPTPTAAHKVLFGTDWPVIDPERAVRGDRRARPAARSRSGC